MASNETAAWYAEAHQLEHDSRDGFRGSYIPFPQCELLDHACVILNDAFNASCYLVGSTTRTKAWRDVDIRMIMDDDQYTALFGSGSKPIFWSIICTSISTWLQKVTGLPIDFQIQSRTNANARYSSKNGNHRNAMGMFPNYGSKDRPDWHLAEPDC